MKVFITGGLGYIGSHIAHKLGKKAIIIDNGINSNLNYKKLLPKATVYKKSLNVKNLDDIFKTHKFNSVIHLASLKSVNQSINEPLRYYKNNVLSTLELLEVMDKYNSNNLVFSSSATVYGNKNISPMKEDMALSTNNPYGSTKVIIEKLIDDYSLSNSNFKCISLRYFNPIGGNSKAGLADKPNGNPQNIIPVLINAVKENKKFYIYGKNYNTPDGTCIRDYIHIDDLAMAHIQSLKNFHKIKSHVPINIGLGKGISVLSLVKLFEKVNKLKVKFEFTKKRPGDAAITYANIDKAKKILGWLPRLDYEDMLKDSWLASNR